MKKNICIAIPLGVTTNNMPDPEFLEFGLRLLKEQTIPIEIVIAADENLQDDRVKICEKYADKIKYFPADSYFRPGGIWKKIWECWKETECEFIGWNGYDDYSDRARFEYQYNKLNETKAGSCICSNYVNKNGNIQKVNNGDLDFIEYIGKHALFMGSFLIRKNNLFKSGISNYIDCWSYYFEGLLYYYILKMGIPTIADKGIFYYREHSSTISNTCKPQQKWVQKAVKDVNYTFAQCKNDWDEINFDEKCKELKNYYKIIRNIK
jgi:hypothetical protein